MNYVEKYLKSANRGNFQYSCIETTDSYGCGGCKVEEVTYEGRHAKITKYGLNEFECEIDLKNEPYYIIEIRANRSNARNFVEKIIMNDIKNNEKNLKYKY